MSNKFSEFEKQEAERIAKFRAERAKVNAAEKNEQVKEAEIEAKKPENVAARAKEAKVVKETAERKVEAQALLPGTTQVERIRKQILRERRNRKLLNFLQVLIFVLLPTGLVGYYNAKIAVPLFEARSVITISKPGGQQDAGLPGVLGAMVPQTNMSEAFMAKEFIGSKEMMNALEAEVGFLSYFGSTDMDPMQRLRDIVDLQIGVESFYHSYVRTSINIQTGLLTLYVSARSPKDAQRFSLAILTLAEAHIRDLSEALFREQVVENEAGVARTRSSLETARLALTELQISSGVTNPRESVAGVYGAIAVLEGQLLELHSKIDETELSGYGDSPQMAQYQNTMIALKNRVDQQRLRLTDTTEGRSLNQVLADYEFALIQIEIAEQTWASALGALDQARSSAALGVSHFQIVVPPNASNIATYPNRIKSILLAFLVFFGIFSAFKVFRPKVY